jgi:hypothetical protein
VHFSNYYAFIALDLARQRVAEADASRLAALAHPAPARPSGLRRAIARVALAVARTADAEVGRAAVTTH